MAKITKTYTFTDEEVLAHAQYYGWTEQVLDEDGKTEIPNPVTPVEYLSAEYDKFISGWFTQPAIILAKKKQKDAIKAASKEAKTAIDSVEQTVASNLKTVIS
jgi:hypothetical protein